jgi:hypothetical protein
MQQRPTWSNHPFKATPPNPTTPGIKFPSINVGGHIQTLAMSKLQQDEDTLAFSIQSSGELRKRKARYGQCLLTRSQMEDKTINLELGTSHLLGRYSTV